jgi:beta-N-acetylhexosaminidase
MLLEEYGIGSFILFEKNIPESGEALKQLIKDINDKSESLSLPRPIISIDHEGGRVHRLRNLATLFPPVGQTADLPDEAIIEADLPEGILLVRVTTNAGTYFSFLHKVLR